MTQPDTSLIINVYNMARQAELCLETVARQTVRNFEVIIADDGSADRIASVIEHFRQTHSDIPIRHEWHEDQGFWRTGILNRGFRSSSSEYIIVVDGDMLLHPSFVENHQRYRAPKRVLAGYRGVKLNLPYAAALKQGQDQFSPILWKQFVGALRGEIAKPLRGLVIHPEWLHQRLVPKRHELSGCNFSMYIDALKAVNGMDESIHEYGYEDFELGQRLQRAGYSIFNVSKRCNTYHLEHPKSGARNVEGVKQRIRELNETQCRLGLLRLETGSSSSDFATTRDATLKG